MNDRAISTTRKDAIDWGEVHGRVEAAQAALEAGLQQGTEERRQILRERAKVMAREAEKAKAGAHLEVVEFGLADETYAFESIHVREVHPLQELTVLPCAPRFVQGVVNVRGQILSVVDLKKFFDLPDQGLSDLNRILILHSAEMEFGILADAIPGTRRIRLSELQTSLPTLTEVRQEYLKGVTEDRTVILDAEKLLADPDLIVHEEVET